MCTEAANTVYNRALMLKPYLIRVDSDLHYF